MIPRARHARGTTDAVPWSGEGQGCLGGLFAKETPSLTSTPLLGAKMPVLGLGPLIGAHPRPRTDAPASHRYLRAYPSHGMLRVCVCGMDASQTWYQSLSQEAHRCCGRTLHPQSWKEHLDHVLPPLRVTDRETETQGREWTWQIRDRSGAGTSLSQLGVQVVVGNVGKSLLASRRCGLEPARPLGQ